MAQDAVRRSCRELPGAFEKDPELGMVCPPIVEHYARSVNFGGNLPLMKLLLREYGFSLPGDAL